MKRVLELRAHGVPAQCLPGRSRGRPDAAAAALPGFSVVHLHGGMTHASSDGWAENLAAPGQPALDAYPNDQRATMLWYHDHVMGVTRFNVYAGLAGLWIVRDERERELELPEGPHELPLLLTDRNFDTNEDGGLGPLRAPAGTDRSHRSRSPRRLWEDRKCVHRHLTAPNAREDSGPID